MSKGYRKAAFTLAEVLVTLGIIGVVAALTLPALTANKQKEELRTALKKNYSAMQQALNKMSVDAGETIIPGTLTRTDFKNKLMKNYIILKDCGYGSFEAKACIANFGVDVEGTSLSYTTLNGKKASLRLFDDGQFITADGSMYMLENNSGPIYISVDVNGFEKRPNKWGYDLFTFQLTKDGKLLPMGAEGTNYYDETNAFCSKTSTHEYNGIGCTYDALYKKEYWKQL